ncbi:MAG: hypothetical protein H0V44_13435 [Planctomycetes bacterium]|nr:hypothetical protein [Planctomycetota bacterium]
MRGLVIVVVSLAAGIDVSAAIAGMPEPPTPGPLPSAWVEHANDNLADGVLNNDDYRTGAFSGGGQWRSWVVAADASVLTHKRPFHGVPPGRSDEFTLTVGHTLVDDPPSERNLHGLVIAGVGMRVSGSLGGETLQSALHAGSGYDDVRLPYDRDRAADGLVYVLGREVLSFDPSASVSWAIPATVWGLAATAQGLATSGGEFQASLGLDLVVIGAQGSTWVGGRYQWNEGTQATPTAATVAAHEEGPWVVAGASVGPLPMPIGGYLRGGINPSTRAAMGSIGLTVHPRTYRSAGRALVEQSIGYYQGAVIGVQVRWSPRALDAAERWWLHHDAIIDYRFGGVPRDRWRGNQVLSDQILLGHSPSLNLMPAWPIRLMPYASGGLGVRTERVAVREASARFAEESATTGVFQMGFGLRLAFATRRASTVSRTLDHLRLGVGYDRWFPWRSHEISRGADRDRYLQVDGGFGGTLGWLMLW